MKPLFHRFILLSFAWMLLGSATTIHKTAAKEPSLPAAKQAMYYWYWADSDTFFEYASLAQAENDFEAATGFTVNTTTSASKIANGYTNNVMPHNTIPFYVLYEH